MRCQQHGQLDEAAALYRKVLEANPEHADALHYSGVLAHQRGRLEEGLALVRRSLDIVPSQADWHSNLGRMLQDSGQLEEAIAAYRRALELEPGHANALNNLGALLKVQGLVADAEAAYRAAIGFDPHQADAYHNLAILLGATGRRREAITCFYKALTLRPRHPDARPLHAVAYSEINETGKAARLCEEWASDEPDNPLAIHTLAAVTGRSVPDRASDAYIEQVFDRFSATFEARLAHLRYRAPKLVARAVAAAHAPAPKALDVLDSGCGTGQCGPLLAPYARRLVGVDLSSGMLSHARHKHVYDELIARELTAFLQSQKSTFDLVVSADTLVYFGALDAVAAAVARALRSGGRFVFTVERADPDVATYCLRPHGRFNHAASYIERVLTGAGLRATWSRARLRMESGKPVAGLLVSALKS
jgi:predicted TPR repeat methyltransferase